MGVHRWYGLAGNQNAATRGQRRHCEVGRRIFDEDRLVAGRSGIFYHLEEAAHGAAEGARIQRDNVVVFRTQPTRRGTKIEDIISNGTIVLDCVDSTVVRTVEVLVGHQDLTAEGPEAWRGRYSWSFRVCGMLCVGRARDEVDMWSPWKVVNRKDGAVLARYDHFVAKCAHFVERNRAVVREGAPDLRKGRDDTSRELIDVKAFCDEKVGRVEPGVRGLYWSELQVFFNAGVIPSRNLPHHRRNPVAVDMREILAAP